MWEAYNTGVSPDAYDAVKNEFGYTYGFHTPLVIDGKVIGVITAEQEVENVNKGILINTGKQLVILAVIFIMGMVLLLLFVNLNYITRLERLERGVTRYSDTKDPSIAREIEKYAKGDDEISNLSGKIAIMILELEDYMNNLIMTVDELNETKKKTSVMSDLALKDALTGIRNKAAYEQEAHKLSWSVAENTAVFGIAVINLNFLKSINENYGHEQGNLAIKNLCRLVCDIFQHSAVFRVGSDELAAILGKGDYENSDELIRKFESCIAENSNKTDQDPWEAFSAAIGYAKYDKYVDKSVEDVFNRAEKAMKNRKKEMKV